MGVKIVVQPTVTPVEVLGLDAIKQHLRVATDITDEDDLVTAYVLAAWDCCERLAWRQMLTADLRLTMPSWSREILIPKPPTASILSVKYYDEDNVLQTLDGANYRTDLESDIASILPVSDVGFPDLYDRPDAVQVNFRAGYGITLASLPACFLHAVRLLTGQYYETREPEAVSTTTADHLLSAISCRDERLLQYM